MITFPNETQEVSFSSFLSRRARKYGLQENMNYYQFYCLYEMSKIKRKRLLFFDKIIDSFEPDLYIEDLEVIIKKYNKYYDQYGNIIFLSSDEITILNNVYNYEITEKGNTTIFKRRH